MQSPVLSFLTRWQKIQWRQNSSKAQFPILAKWHFGRTLAVVVLRWNSATLLKKEAGLAKGSGVPNKNKVGKVTKAQLLKIVEIKKADLNTDDPEQAVKMIAGTARNMGIEVVE